MHNKPYKLVKKQPVAQPMPEIPQLTPAEQVEVDRFKRLTRQKAVRRALVTRLIARFQARDDLSNAA